jgi:hypothetical protein
MNIRTRNEKEIRISASYGEFYGRSFFEDLEEFLQKKDLYFMTSNGHDYLFDAAENKIYFVPDFECFMRGWNHDYTEGKEPLGVFLRCKRVELEEDSFLQEFMNPEEFEAQKSGYTIAQELSIKQKARSMFETFKTDKPNRDQIEWAILSAKKAFLVKVCTFANGGHEYSRDSRFWDIADGGYAIPRSLLKGLEALLKTYPKIP